MKLKDRIRGYLPVVIDVETSGFNEQTDALLEICAIILGMDEEGSFFAKTTLHYHVEPFKGANIEASAIKFNGIDIDNPFRLAVPEKKALSEIFDHINEELETEECSRAILVGHNAFFDLGFVKAATLRANLKSPFHQFSTIDLTRPKAQCCFDHHWGVWTLPAPSVSSCCDLLHWGGCRQGKPASPGAVFAVGCCA